MLPSGLQCGSGANKMAAHPEAGYWPTSRAVTREPQAGMRWRARLGNERR